MTVLSNKKSSNGGSNQESGRLNAPGEITFRVGPLVNLASLVRSLGFDPVTVFAEVGFSPDEFDHPDNRASYLRCSKLMAHCAEFTACDHIGLLLGEMAEPSYLGIPGFLVRTAPSVKVALQSLVDNLDLHDEGGTAVLEINADYTSLGYAIQIPGVVAAEQIYDLAAAMLYKVMRSLCGAAWSAKTVHLARSVPRDTVPYKQFFKTAVFFDASETAILFPGNCLKNEPPSADELLYQHLKQEAKELHALQHHELIQELPAVLVRGLLTEQFAAHQVASSFGMHERTLHRRLRLAGTNFRQELDSARQSVSEQLLGSTSLPVCDIATALGYADSSGFIRAFQRWQGTSPTSWRKHNSILPGKRPMTEVT